MKFEIQKKMFQDVLSRVQGLTGRKSNLAITQTVLIEAMPGQVRISATDTETGFIGTYDAAVETEGRIALNAKKLFEIIREFPNATVDICEVENRWIEIGRNKVQFHIVGMNPDDFPDIPVIQDIPFFEMESESLSRLIEGAVHIFPPGDESRAHLAGAYLKAGEHEGGGMRLQMVSTDGHRLFLGEYPFDGLDAPFDAGILLPKKGLQDVNRFLSTEEVVKIGIKDNHFVIKKARETFTLLLLEGDFPTYQQLFLCEDQNDIHLDRGLFLMMLKRMSILSTEDYKGVIFSFEEDMLVIRTTNPEIGESKEEMQIAYQREPLEAAFNPRFFIDALNLIDEDGVVINIYQADRPCLVRGENDQTFMIVIMPMKL